MSFFAPQRAQSPWKVRGLLSAGNGFALVFWISASGALWMPQSVHADPLGLTLSSPPTLRVADIGVTACAGTVEIPILAKNYGSMDGAFVALEFDASLVGYAWYKEASPAWQVDRAIPYGRERVQFLLHQRDVSGAGRTAGQPGNDVDSGDNTQQAYDLREGESVLFTVVLYLRTTCRNDRGFAYRSEIRLGAHDPSKELGDSYFFLAGAGDVQRPWPTVLEAGRFDVYLQDGIELGWGSLTKTAQEFSLPLYLTSIQPGQTTFLVGVDYDELFLNVTRVRGQGPALEEEAGASLDVRVPGKAFFALELRSDGKGPLCGVHMADLHFQYNGDLLPQGELLVKARLLREIPPPESLLDPPGEPGEGEDEVFGQGGAYGEAIPGVISLLPAYFVRGNVDSTIKRRSDGRLEYLPDVLDVQQILQSIFLGDIALDCADAADADNSGRVEITDAILLLNYLFRGGTPPRGPFPFPGPDSNAGTIQDSLDCERPVPIFRTVPLR